MDPKEKKVKEEELNVRKLTILRKTNRKTNKQRAAPADS